MENDIWNPYVVTDGFPCDSNEADFYKGIEGAREEDLVDMLDQYLEYVDSYIKKSLNRLLKEPDDGKDSE